jgi:hypothetical protein
MSVSFLDHSVTYLYYVCQTLSTLKVQKYVLRKNFVINNVNEEKVSEWKIFFPRN